MKAASCGIQSRPSDCPHAPLHSRYFIDFSPAPSRHLFHRDLAQLIFDLKNVNPKAKISVKLVAESGVGTIAAGVAKAKADLIVISGAEGGTGASPASSIRYAGISPELGLSETQQTLVLNGCADKCCCKWTDN